MKRIVFSVGILPILLLVIPHVLSAQTTHTLTSGKIMSVTILGSSNVHDWTMTSSGLESQGDFKFDAAKNQLLALSDFSFTIDARSLKSGHESMDNRTYKAIQADRYPAILYKLRSAVVTPTQKNKYVIKALGDLTIAGVTQTLVIAVNAEVNSDNSVNCTGSEKLKLTDYKVNVPSFMLGTMTVSNDLIIQFNFTCKKKSIIL